jgi:uncharacterized protein (DUF427 family)
MTLPLGPGEVHVEAHARRVQGFIDDRAVIDTEAALMVHRSGVTLAYAFPVEVVGDLAGTPVPEAPGYVTVSWDVVDRWVEEGRELVFYPPNPYHRVDCRPARRRLKVIAGDTVLVDTDQTVILFETGLVPRLYVAPVYLRPGLLVLSETTTYCNYKGWASYWSTAEEPDVAWSYGAPLPESLPITGYFSFDPTKVIVEAELPNL